MHGKRVLIIGLGKIGYQVATLLADENQVWGLRRSSGEDSNIIDFIQGDVTAPQSLITLPKNLDLVLYCLSPSSIDDEGYKTVFVDGLINVLEVIKRTSPKAHLFFVSSSSVYHQDDDSWVDEDSPTEAKKFSGQRLLEGEMLLANSGIEHSIIRFTGIYGNGRTRMLDQVRSGKTALASESPFTNRIHEADCIGFIIHLMELVAKGDSIEPLYLATDSLPIRRNDFLSGIATMLGIQIKSDGVYSSMRAGSKRCSNKKLIASGYTLKYPSFESGYQEMINKLKQEGIS